MIVYAKFIIVNTKFIIFNKRFLFQVREVLEETGIVCEFRWCDSFQFDFISFHFIGLPTDTGLRLVFGLF